MTARTKSYLLLLAVSAIWGVAGPIIKYTVGYLPPLIFLVYRFAIAAAFAVVTLKFTNNLGWPKKTSDQIWIFVYCFLTSTVSLGLLFFGYEKTSALSASVIDALYPIMVAIIGVSFLHEHVTNREKLGMGIALLGTFLVVIEPLFNGHLRHVSTLTGNLLIFASLVVGVILIVLAKIILRKHSSALALTQLSFIIGFLTTLPLVLLYHSPVSIIQSLVTAPLGAHLGVAFMALISGTLAYTLWHQAQKSIEIGEAALFTYTYPVFTAPLALLWLHEPLTPVFLVGAGITVVGVVIAEIKPHRP